MNELNVFIVTRTFSHTVTICETFLPGDGCAKLRPERIGARSGLIRLADNDAPEMGSARSIIIIMSIDKLLGVKKMLIGWITHHIP